MIDLNGKKPGDCLRVRQYKSDGSLQRSWQARIEHASDDEIVLVSPAGSWVEDVRGGWATQHVMRAFYWPEKWYNLLEVYTLRGELAEVYVNINSPVTFGTEGLAYVDYELDVSRIPPGKARLVDEDEFEQAAVQYGYTEAFRQACYRAASEALALADEWVARGAP